MIVFYPPEPITAIGLATLSPGDAEASLCRLEGAGREPGSNQGAPYGADGQGDAVGESGPVTWSHLDSLRRRCGIPRPSTASRSAVAAAVACRALLPALPPNARLSIATVSTTSAIGAATEFEARGLRESWSSVDPLLLPSTLPSALATQLAMALGAHASAVSCTIGLLGMFHAIESALHSLSSGDTDVALVVSSEERSGVQEVAHRRLGWLSVPSEHAGVLALRRGSPGDCRIGFLSYGEHDLADCIPEGWRDAPVTEVVSALGSQSMQGAAAFQAIRSRLIAGHGRSVVRGILAGQAAAAIGIERP